MKDVHRVLSRVARRVVFITTTGTGNAPYPLHSELFNTTIETGGDDGTYDTRHAWPVKVWLMARRLKRQLGDSMAKDTRPTQRLQSKGTRTGAKDTWFWRLFG